MTEPASVAIAVELTPAPIEPWVNADPDDDTAVHRRAGIQSGAITIDIEDVHDRGGGRHIEFVTDGADGVLNAEEFEDARTALELARQSLSTIAAHDDSVCTPDS